MSTNRMPVPKTAPKTMALKNFAISATVGIFFLGVVPVARTAELRLDGDRMFLRADRERLEVVLREFVRAGVWVEVEPGIDAMVDGTLSNEPIQKGLARLFDDFNYILFWKQIRGPLEPILKLNEIHLFRPGRHYHVQPFIPTGNDFVVAGSPPHATNELLMELKPGTSSSQFREMLALIGATAVDSLPDLGIYQVRLPRNSDVPLVVARLRGNPWVALAEPNYVYEIDAPIPIQPTVVDAAEPSSARPVEEGPRVGLAALAILDSGLVSMEELGQAVVGAYDAVNPDRPINDPVGHGTQMALLAAGAVVPYGIPAGVATEPVPVLAVRSFDDQGRATSFSLIRSIDYAVQQNARVVSMSWGSEIYSEFVAEMVQLAQDNGLIVVASAGNDPVNRPVYPAAYPGVLAIAATEADGSLWPRSNYGSFLFAAAPGVGEFPVGYQGPPGIYAGTSIASPTIARALTLYLGAHPDVTAAAAVAALEAALTDAGEKGRDDRYGHGVLDAAALRRFLRR